jgi:hypothetical protein
MQRPPDTLFTAAFVALTLSDLAYFMAGGVLIAVTPFFVTGPLRGGPAAVGVAVGAFSVAVIAGCSVRRSPTSPRRNGRALQCALKQVEQLRVLVCCGPWIVGAGQYAADGMSVHLELFAGRASCCARSCSPAAHHRPSLLPASPAEA